MGNFRDLVVWQRAGALATRVDTVSRRLGRGHAELADQLRRAALSIPTNIAEGASKGRDGDFVRFIGIAIGSAAEVESLLAHVEALRLVNPRTCAALTAELTVVRKMLFKLRSAIGRAGGVSTIDHRPPTTDDQP